jgi:Peptidase inhibitor family I36
MRTQLQRAAAEIHGGTMRKPILGLIAAGLMAAGLPVALVTTTASATTAPHRTVSAAEQAADTGGLIALSSSTDTTLPSCPSSTLCTFQNYAYGGTRWNFPWSSYPHGQWFWIGSGPNDKISSLYNHRGWISDFAKNCPADNNAVYIGGEGHVYNLNNGSSSNTWQDNTSVNDSISAIALWTSNTPSYPPHGSC